MCGRRSLIAWLSIRRVFEKVNGEGSKDGGVFDNQINYHLLQYVYERRGGKQLFPIDRVPRNAGIYHFRIR